MFHWQKMHLEYLYSKLVAFILQDFPILEVIRSHVKSSTLEPNVHFRSCKCFLQCLLHNDENFENCSWIVLSMGLKLCVATKTSERRQV